jgi:hypothetical protein
MSYGAWSFGVRDTTWMGWSVFLLYFVSAALCYFASLKKARSDTIVWRCGALLMFMFGVNKQLDFQTLLTEIGRAVLSSFGLLEHRLLVQYSFVFLMVLTLTGFAFAAKRAIGPNSGRFTFLFVGLASIFTFFSLRAASFHHVDRLLGIPVLGMTSNFLFEAFGIVVVAVSAIRAKSPPKQPAGHAFLKAKQIEREMYIEKHRSKDHTGSGKLKK